jgi:AraC-like DNA-binding protein
LDPASRWLEAWIDLGPDLYRALVAMRVLRNDAWVWTWGLSKARIARFVSLSDELAKAGPRDLPDLCIRCQSLVVDASRSADRHMADNDPVERICRLLGSEAATRLDLRAFCRRERLDYEQVRKSFRQRLGIPLGQFRIRRRIERACMLLHSTARSVSAIAEELGYHSAYEFSAQFRQWMGMPPSRYRGS